MGFHPIQKIRSLPKAVKWMIAVLAFLFILSNLYHWYKVWGLPLFYYIPEHSFKVVDADTGEPIEGVAAVEIYDMMPIYDTSEGFQFVLPFLDPWTISKNPANLKSPLRVGISESMSDNSGNVLIPPLGPIKRPRNFAFDYQSLVLVLYHRDYELTYITYTSYPNKNIRSENYIPNWNMEDISINHNNFHSKSDICNKFLPKIKIAKSKLINADSIYKDYSGYFDDRASTFLNLLDHRINELQERCFKDE